LTILTLHPDANGQQGNWLPTPAERARWDCVDEDPFDDSDYITENSALRMGQYIRIEDSGMSEGTITNVKTVVRMRRLMAFDNDFREGLWVSWGDMGWGDYHKVSYLAWIYYFVDWSLTPQGNAWTWAKVDTVEIMVGTNIAQSYMMPQVSQCYIVVTYEEAPPPTEGGMLAQIMALRNQELRNFRKFHGRFGIRKAILAVCGKRFLA